jgi:hypothetical protein
MLPTMPAGHCGSRFGPDRIGDGRVPELCKGLAGAAAGCHELAAANLDGVRDQVLLAWEYRFARHVLESLDGHYTGGQQLFDHPGSTFLGFGSLPRLLHSRG